MDLKIRDVANLLNVSESTIRRWVSDGRIPTYRINQHHFFSRTEIENWVISHKLDQTGAGASPFVRTRQRGASSLSPSHGSGMGVANNLVFLGPFIKEMSCTTLRDQPQKKRSFMTR